MGESVRVWRDQTDQAMRGDTFRGWIWVGVGGCGQIWALGKGCQM